METVAERSDDRQEYQNWQIQFFKINYSNIGRNAYIWQCEWTSLRCRCVSPGSGTKWFRHQNQTIPKLELIGCAVDFCGIYSSALRLCRTLGCSVDLCGISGCARELCGTSSSSATFCGIIGYAIEVQCTFGRAVEIPIPFSRVNSREISGQCPLKFSHKDSTCISTNDILIGESFEIGTPGLFKITRFTVNRGVFCDIRLRCFGKDGFRNMYRQYWSKKNGQKVIKIEKKCKFVLIGGKNKSWEGIFR